MNTLRMVQVGALVKKKVHKMNIWEIIHVLKVVDLNGNNEYGKEQGVLIWDRN